MQAQPIRGLRSLVMGGIVAALGLGTPALAFNFDEQSVNADEFILVASPIHDGGHQLLILRQLSNERPCWREENGVVDMLLTTFDFTGICGRSTDSNGYSLRMAGRDLGTDYSLRLMQSSDSLVLVAIPDRDRSAASFAIGQTNGITSGFAKIELYPDWYISQRAYQGQALGHFYLTHAQDHRSTIATLPQRGLTQPRPAPSQPEPSLNSTPDAAPTISLPPAMPNTAPLEQRPTDSGDWIEFGQTPAPLTPSNPPVAAAPPTPPPPVPSGMPTLPPPTPLEPVPSLTPPVGNTGSMPNVSVAPSSSQAASLGFSYRVVVYTTSSQQEARVRSLVPDAFRTNLNGQTVMQAGLFEERTAADQLQQSLANQGLSASVVPVN